VLGKWVFEALYRDDRGRPAVSYDLTNDGFCVFGSYVLGRKAIKRSFASLMALMDKDAELQAAEAALPRTVDELIRAIEAGADLHDPNMVKAIACIWMKEADRSPPAGQGARRGARTRGGKSVTVV
jgi:hypothetical protein